MPLRYRKYLEGRHCEYSKYPEYVPKDMLDHRVNEEIGKLEIRTPWEQFTNDWRTAEAVTSFIGDVTKKWFNYCKRHGVDADLTNEAPKDIGARQICKVGQAGTFPSIYRQSQEEVRHLPQILHKERRRKQGRYKGGGDNTFLCTI